MRKVKRLFIGTTEIAGIAYTLNRAFKKIGIKSSQVSFSRHPFDYSIDKCLDISGKPKAIRYFILLTNFIKSLFLYDSFFFISGTSLLPRNLDLPILKLFRKKMIVMYYGGDIRLERVARERNKYYYLRNLKNKDEEKIRRMKKVAKYIDIAIVGDYELYEYAQPYFKKVEVVPQALDLEKYTPIFPNPFNKKLLIIHSPSNRMKKGTKYVLRAIKGLELNYQFDFQLIHNLSHIKACALYKRADIIIDQLLSGSHGILTIEAMALSKPVLCYIREDLIKYRPDLPIVNANPDNIYEKLKLLLENPELRRDLGIKGRKYVEKYHDSLRIARKLVEIYNEF